MPYVGEVRMMSFDVVPEGWAECNGQELAITEHQTLFKVLGTTYGGDGTTTFRLPDLQGRVPIHGSPEIKRGTPLGAETHKLSPDEMPAHVHVVAANTQPASSVDGNQPGPNRRLAASTAQNLYGKAGGLVGMSPDDVDSVGGSQPHANVQPFVTVKFCIALAGLDPYR